MPCTHHQLTDRLRIGENRARIEAVNAHHFHQFRNVFPVVAVTHLQGEVPQPSSLAPPLFSRFHPTGLGREWSHLVLSLCFALKVPD